MRHQLSRSTASGWRSSEMSCARVGEEEERKTNGVGKRRNSGRKKRRRGQEKREKVTASRVHIDVGKQCIASTSTGFKVQGLRFRVEGLGFMV